MKMRQTSFLAGESIAGDRSRLQRAVLDAIRAQPATCDELEVRLGLKHQTCSARIRELSGINAIVDSGATRPTRSGRKAIVWTVTA